MRHRNLKTLAVIAALCASASAQAATPPDLIGTWSSPQTIQIETDGLVITVKDLVLVFEDNETGDADFQVEVEGGPFMRGFSEFQVDSRFEFDVAEQTLTAGRWTGRVRPVTPHFLTNVVANELQSALPTADDTVLRIVKIDGDRLLLRQDDVAQTYELVRAPEAP